MRMDNKRIRLSSLFERIPTCCCINNKYREQICALFRDRRLHVIVFIDGYRLKGLFDPGSCCSYIGKRAIGNFSMTIDALSHSSSSEVVYSNGVIEEVLGRAIMSVQFLSYNHRMPIRFAPTFNYEVILGHEFSEVFDFEVKYKKRIWRIEDCFWHSYEGNRISLGLEDEKPGVVLEQNGFQPINKNNNFIRSRCSKLQDDKIRNVSSESLPSQCSKSVNYRRYSPKVLEALRSSVEKLER